MVNRSKAIGTAGESAVVNYARLHGFSGAERLALHGTADQGDATLCPGVGVEVKAGHAAETASDAQIAAWLLEAETERVNRGADVMLLILKRKGKGVANVGSWNCYLPGWAYIALAYGHAGTNLDAPAVHINTEDAMRLLRLAGYGDPL